jgi:hypothetical protein
MSKLSLKGSIATCTLGTIAKQKPQSILSEKRIIAIASGNGILEALFILGQLLVSQIAD